MYWYLAGSLLAGAGLVVLGYGSGMNTSTVSMDWRVWKLNRSEMEGLQKEGRICVTKTVSIGPVRYSATSFDSGQARAEREAARQAR